MQAQTAEAPKPKRQLSERHKQRVARANLTVKQAKFVKAYAKLGNGRAAAKAAGYSDSSDSVLRQQAAENLAKPYVAAALQREIGRSTDDIDYSAGRVMRRLDHLSHAAEGDKQHGVAVRAEELIGRTSGMWVDIQLKGNLSADHLDALLQVARARQAQPLNLGDSRPDTKR